MIRSFVTMLCLASGVLSCAGPTRETTPKPAAGAHPAPMTAVNDTLRIADIISFKAGKVENDAQGNPVLPHPRYARAVARAYNSSSLARYTVTITWGALDSVSDWVQSGAGVSFLNLHPVAAGPRDQFTYASQQFAMTGGIALVETRPGWPQETPGIVLSNDELERQLQGSKWRIDAIPPWYILLRGRAVASGAVGSKYILAIQPSESQACTGHTHLFSLEGRPLLGQADDPTVVPTPPYTIEKWDGTLATPRKLSVSSSAQQFQDFVDLVNQFKANVDADVALCP